MQLSRSEQKRRLKDLEKLVSALALLPESTIAALPCESEVRAQFRKVARMKGGARKRQLKYITKLLRDQPVDRLYAFLSSRKGAALEQSRQFHEIEYLRDRLVDEAMEYRQAAISRGLDLEEQWESRVVAEILARFPSVEASELVRLAHLFARSRHKRYYREIFRLLRAAAEEERLARNRQNVSQGG